MADAVPAPAASTMPPMKITVYHNRNAPITPYDGTPELARKAPDDTLSEHVWKWFGVGRPGNRPSWSGWVQLRRFVLLAGLAARVGADHAKCRR